MRVIVVRDALTITDDTMSALCEDCGAPLEGRVTSSGVVVCAYCGSAHDVHRIAAQGRRTPIATADFSGSTIRGWHNGPRLTGTPVAGPPQAWSISMANDGLHHPLLWAPGSFDDFDVTLAVRFVACDPRDAVFLKARRTSAGCVTLRLFAGGVVTLGWMRPDDTWCDDVVTARPVEPPALGAWWRLRWVAVGARHRAYLDGAPVFTATHEPIRHSGDLDVRLLLEGPSMTVELAELALFTPPESV